MGFVAGDIAEPLDWDFTAFGTPEDRGVIPDPSPDAVDLFGWRYRALLQELYQTIAEDHTAVEGETTEQAAERIAAHASKPLMQRLDEWAARTTETKAENARINDELRRILADICGGSPTLAQIELLPSRHLRLFTAWLNEELSAPKPKAGALSSTAS